MRWLVLLLVIRIPARADDPVLDFPPVKVRLEQPEVAEGRNFWTTPRFRIDADSAIHGEAVGKLAVIAESTFAALRGHLLPLFAPPVGHQPGISLYQDSKAYEDAGAPRSGPGSVGKRGAPGEAACFPESTGCAGHRDRARPVLAEQGA
jgi:hypothetical protein